MKQTFFNQQSLEVIRKDIEQKSVSTIAAFEVAAVAVMGKDLFQDQEKSENFHKTLDQFKYLIAQVNIFLDSIITLYSLPMQGITVALNDQAKTDAEKIELLSILVSNAAEFMPPDWQEYYKIKLKSINEWQGNRNQTSGK
jgi:hypothetical protein